MTQKEFKAAMLRGHGRCVQAARQEPEKYRKIVLWACGRNIAYDAQCEGTRAWLVYTLANCYPDRETFIQAAADALKRYRPNIGWDLLHLTELLMWFAWEGCGAARQAVEDKYREILAGMLARRRRPNRIFHELQDLEQLGLVLATDSRAFLRIAADFGRLYRETKYMLDGDFLWFFEEKGSQYRKTLERAAKGNADIACFLEREQADIDAREVQWKQRQNMTPETYTGIRLSRWLAKNGDRDTLERYACAYREQKDPALRAKALMAFSCCSYPGDPRPVMEDAGSACGELQNAAWRALEHIRHPDVREFAKGNVAAGIRTPENYGLLVSNYLPEDADLLESLLREWIEAEDWDCVHAAGLDIHRAFYRNSGIPHPKHLLPLLYEYNPCSSCRESELIYMTRYRMVTKEIWEECLCDSNDNIRRMAAKRRKK